MDGLAVILIIITIICAIIGILLSLKLFEWDTGEEPREEQEYMFIFPKEKEHKAEL